MSALTELRENVSPVVKAMGFSIVELESSVVSGRTHVHLVIYRPSGVSIDDCAEVHRTVQPRLETLMDDRDIALQVASPGVDRAIKSNIEYSVFVGRGEPGRPGHTRRADPRDRDRCGRPCADGRGALPTTTRAPSRQAIRQHGANGGLAGARDRGI